MQEVGIEVQSFLVPGEVDKLARNLYQIGDFDLRGVAAAFSHRTYYTENKVHVKFTQKKNTLILCNRQPILDYWFSIHFDQYYCEYTALLMMHIQLCVNKVKIAALREAGLPLNMLDSKTGKKFTARRGFKVAYRMADTPNLKLKLLLEGRQTSQFIPCELYQSDGMKFFSRDFTIPKVPETPNYIIKVYDVMEIALRRVYSTWDEASIYSALVGCGIDDPKIQTHGRFDADGKSFCLICNICDLELTGLSDDEKMEHFKLFHWGYTDKLERLCSYAKEEYVDSRVICGNAESIAAAAINVMKDKLELNCSEKHLQLAIMAGHRYCGYKRGSFRVADFDTVQKCLKEPDFPMPKDTNSGPLPVNRTGYYDSANVKVDTSCKKRHARELLMRYLNEIIDELREYVKDLEHWQITCDSLRKIIPLCLTAMMTKVETKTKRDDLNKIRVFFMASGLDYLIAKIMLEHVYKNHQHGQGVAIGQKWFEGDGQRIYNTLRRYNKWFYLDFTQFDISLKPTLLMWHKLILMIYMCDDLTTIDAKLTICFLKYLADRQQVKLVRSVNTKWYVCGGKMMSGKFDTSQGDSEYEIDIPFYTIFRRAEELNLKKYVAEQMSRMQRLVLAGKFKELVEIDFFIYSYGDNLLCATRGLMDEILTLKDLKRYAEKEFHMIIKWKNCKTGDGRYPDSELDKFGNLKLEDWKDPDGGLWHRPRGIIWLKFALVLRQFKGKQIVTMYRPTGDYLAKIGRCHIDVKNPGIAFMRITGNIINASFGNRNAIALMLMSQRILTYFFPTIIQNMSEELDSFRKNKEFMKWVGKLQDRVTTDDILKMLTTFDVAKEYKIYGDKCLKVINNKETIFDIRQNASSYMTRYQSHTTLEELIRMELDANKVALAV